MSGAAGGGAGRAEGRRAALWVAVLAVLASYGAIARQVLPQPASGPRLCDYAQYHGASRMAVRGELAAAYTDAVLCDEIRTFVPLQGKILQWPYPPTFALFVRPLAGLTYHQAQAAFFVLTFLLYAAAALALARTPLARAVALCTPTLLITLSYGQNGLLTAGLLGLGLAFVDRRPVLGGALLGLATFKPQLAVLVPVALVLGGRWAALAGFVGSALGMAGLSAAAFGPEAWTGWFTKLASTRSQMTGGQLPLHRVAAVYGGAQMLTRAQWFLVPVQLAALLSGVWLAAVAWARPTSLALRAAALLAGTTLVTPYIFGYDLPLLALGIAALVDHGTRRPDPEDVEHGHDARAAPLAPLEALALAWAWGSPLVTPVLAGAVGLPLLPTASLATAWVTARRLRQAAPGGLAVLLTRAGLDLQATPERGRLRRAPLWALAGLVLLAHAACYQGWLGEDGWTSLAYARSLARGEGPVAQVGAQATEAFESPLQVAALALAAGLGAPLGPGLVVGLAFLLVAVAGWRLRALLVSVAGEAGAAAAPWVALTAACSPSLVEGLVSGGGAAWVLLVYLLYLEACVAALRDGVSDAGRRAGVLAGLLAWAGGASVGAVLGLVLLARLWPARARARRRAGCGLFRGLAFTLGALGVARWWAFGDLTPAHVDLAGGIGSLAGPGGAWAWLGAAPLKRMLASLVDLWGSWLGVAWALASGLAWVHLRRAAPRWRVGLEVVGAHLLVAALGLALAGGGGASAALVGVSLLAPVPLFLAAARADLGSAGPDWRLGLVAALPLLVGMPSAVPAAISHGQAQVAALRAARARVEAADAWCRRSGPGPRVGWTLRPGLASWLARWTVVDGRAGPDPEVDLVVVQEGEAAPSWVSRDATVEAPGVFLLPRVSSPGASGDAAPSGEGT